MPEIKLHEPTTLEREGFAQMSAANRNKVEKMARLIVEGNATWRQIGSISADWRLACTDKNGDPDYNGRSSVYRAAQGAAITMALGPKATDKEKKNLSERIRYHAVEELKRRGKWVETTTPPPPPTPESRQDNAVALSVELSDPEKLDKAREKAKKAGKTPPEAPSIVSQLSASLALAMAASSRIVADEPFDVADVQRVTQSLSETVSDLHKHVRALAAPAAVAAE